MIEGAIFDMDGVLVDNAGYHIRAWIQMGRELGTELDEVQVRGVFGQRNTEMIAALLGKTLPPSQVEQYGDRKEEIYRDLIKPELKAVPGLYDLMDDLKSEGFATAVATSGPLENANLVMDGLKLRPWFDAIVTGAEVSRGKPHPDIFLAAARRVNLGPRQCVVFEDSVSGIEAARRAGSPCVALATTHSARELQGLSALRIISDFRAMRAADLRSLAAKVP